MAEKILTKEGKVELTLLLAIVAPILIFMMAFCLFFLFFYHPYLLRDQILLTAVFVICLICTILLFFYYFRSLKEKSPDKSVNWKVVGLTVLSILALTLGLLLIIGSFLFAGAAETDRAVRFIYGCCTSGFILTIVGLFLMLYLNKYHVVKKSE